MRRAAALAVCLLCSSCGREEPPAAVRPPLPLPEPELPRVSVPVPAPEPPAPPAPFTPPAPKPVQVPREAPPSKTPLFTFDSLDGAAEIRINGARVGTTPLAWALADTTCFDPK